jgi:hypothetical protein
MRCITYLPEENASIIKQVNLAFFGHFLGLFLLLWQQILGLLAVLIHPWIKNLATKSQLRATAHRRLSWPSYPYYGFHRRQTDCGV